MARTDCLANFLTDIANAIRDKSKINNQIPAKEFDKFIKSMVVKPKDGNFINWQTWLRYGVVSGARASMSNPKKCIVDQNSLIIPQGNGNSQATLTDIYELVKDAENEEDIENKKEVEDRFKKYGCVLEKNHKYKFSCDVECSENFIGDIYIRIYTEQYKYITQSSISVNLSKKYEVEFEVGETNIYCFISFDKYRDAHTVTYSNIKIEEVTHN